MPWYAVVLMTSGAVLIGLLRLVVTVGRWLGFGADPRPGFLDLRKRRS